MRNWLIVFLAIIALCVLSYGQTSTPSNLYPMQEGFVDSHGAAEFQADHRFNF